MLGGGAVLLPLVAALQPSQALMVKFGNARQRSDVLRVRRDCFPDDRHFSVVPLESLVMILLSRRHPVLLLGDIDTPWQKPLTSVYFGYLLVAVGTYAWRSFGPRYAPYAVLLAAALRNALPKPLFLISDDDPLPYPDREPAPRRGMVPISGIDPGQVSRSSWASRRPKGRATPVAPIV